MTTPLPVQAEDGSFPIIVTLPDDTVGEMEMRRDRIGRAANIVVAYPDRMVVIAMRDGVSDNPQDVDPRSTMDMFVTWLKATSDAKPAIRVTSVNAEQLEDIEYVF